MAKYRHYRLDGTGKINCAEWLDADDDGEAVRQARAFRLPVASEVWCGGRRLARIEPVGES